MSFNDYLKSVLRAGLSGFSAGILTGISIAVILLVNSYSFLAETGRTVLVLAYLIAYTLLTPHFLLINVVKM